MEDLAEQRKTMVETQLIARNINDLRVCRVMEEIPRHLFVPKPFLSKAYEDCPLPIACGQTISQPYIVALMCQELELNPNCRVLDVGAGSGYASAVLAALSDNVTAIEREPELAATARHNLAAAGVENVSVICADGSMGSPDHAPFDAVHVAAGAPVVPANLQEQLKIGGRLVIPVGGPNRFQKLLKIVRNSETQWKTQDLGSVRFVPLIGSKGWPEDLPSP